MSKQKESVYGHLNKEAAEGYLEVRAESAKSEAEGERVEAFFEASSCLLGVRL